MNEVALNTYRIERLEAAIHRVSNGDRTEFGRKLSYKDGAFIRQMLAGTRPISEKTIMKIESMHGMMGWFAIDPARHVAPPRPKGQACSWPFRRIDESKLRDLSGDDLIDLEVAILIAAAQVGLDIKKEN